MRRSTRMFAGALATILCATTAAPSFADGGTADLEPTAQAAVTVISLTDEAGQRTPAGEAGLLDASWPQAHRALSSADAPALSSADAPALLTVPTETGEFLVAAVTWNDGEVLAEGARVYLRVLEDGAWSDWLEVESDDGADDGQAVAGTDPFVTGSAEAVQVQVTGEPTDLPTGLSLHLIPADPDAEPVVSSEPGQSPALLPDGDLTATPSSELTARALITAVSCTVRLAFDEWVRRAELGQDTSVREIYVALRRGLATYAGQIADDL